jgi:anaerobic selenocysteine-containing dehydrogenase
VQYGGPHLCADWKFPTDDGKAHFSVTPVPDISHPEGTFIVASRRGKQFNSMVHENKDGLTGAVREAVLMNAGDAGDLGLADGDEVVLANELGTLKCRVLKAPVMPGTLQVHWPEGQVLLDRSSRSPQGKIPAYKDAVVRVERVTAEEPKVSTPT